LNLPLSVFPADDFLDALASECRSYRLGVPLASANTVSPAAMMRMATGSGS
jgi:hypothetical protein